MEAARLRQAGGGVTGLPIGFRFRPTDEELLLHYLRRKALACPLPADIIPVADLARLHPWDLVPGDAGEDRFFFFRLPATGCWRRGGGAARPAGGAGGAWRASGKERLVASPRCKRPVGAKRTFVFCQRGGRRTDWVMHEYRLLPDGLLLLHNPAHVKSCHAAAAGAMDWVVCRIFKRTKPPGHGGSGGRGREDAEEMIPSSPPSSTSSSCVTDNSSSQGGRGEDDDGEQSSGGDSGRSVASNYRG